MSVSNPVVAPMHNGFPLCMGATSGLLTCANMVIFFENVCMYVLKNIVGVKQLLDKNLDIFYKVRHTSII